LFKRPGNYELAARTGSLQDGLIELYPYALKRLRPETEMQFMAMGTVIWGWSPVICCLAQKSSPSSGSRGAFKFKAYLWKLSKLVKPVKKGCLFPH